jgi:energy-coupling factor transporter ATP-binding protein EcfA2
LRILSADLNDYLSFRECPTIEFREGINLVVGVNNSGKSALLKALNPTLPAQANRSEERFRGSELPSASVTLRIQFSGQRLARAALDMGEVDIPLPHKMRHSANQQEIDDFWGDFFKNDRHSFSVPFHGNGNLDQFRYPAHGLFEPSNNPNEGGFVRVSNKKGKLCFGGLGSERERDSVPSILSSICREDIFNFSAERLNVGASGFGNVRRLSHNADNLPAFLHTLMGERGSITDRLKDHLRAIFPTFGNLTIRSNPANGLAEILIWPTTAMEQPELAFPLSESGTGLGQVIAILSVVMTTTESVIIIDEINSFLHPGAVKALLRLFQTEYNQHQYIISTHSSEVISFSNPSTLHLVRREGYRSSVKALKLDQVDELREVTRELGISMTDVFAADRIVWVEGPTEEICFPEIYKAETKKSVPASCKILAVSDTGRLTEGKNKAAIFQLYRALAEKAAPLVSDVKFSLDSETLTPEQKTDLERAARGSVDFLPRRHLECYLIHAASIAEFIAQRYKETLSDTPVPTAKAVEAALENRAGSKQFKIAEWKNDLEDEAWLARIDAANLINQVCADVSEARLTFNKKRDSLLLLQLVIRNHPAQLAELGDYVRQLVDGPGE